MECSVAAAAVQRRPNLRGLANTSQIDDIRYSWAWFPLKVVAEKAMPQAQLMDLAGGVQSPLCRRRRCAEKCRVVAAHRSLQGAACEPAPQRDLPRWRPCLQAWPPPATPCHHIRYQKEEKCRKRLCLSPMPLDAVYASHSFGYRRGVILAVGLAPGVQPGKARVCLAVGCWLPGRQRMGPTPHGAVLAIAPYQNLICTAWKPDTCNKDHRNFVSGC